MLFHVRNTRVFDRAMAPGIVGEERMSYLLGPELHQVVIFRIEDEISRGSRISKATLVIPILGPAGQPGSLGVARVLRRWDATTVSWEVPWSKPGGEQGIDYGTVRAVPVVCGAAGEVVQVQLDVTADVSRWVSGRSRNVGWMLHGDVRVGGRSNPLIAATPRVDVKYIDVAAASAGAGFGGL